MALKADWSLYKRAAITTSQLHKARLSVLDHAHQHFSSEAAACSQVSPQAEQAETHSCHSHYAKSFADTK